MTERDDTHIGDPDATLAETSATEASPGPSRLERGRTVGRYLVVELLGAGAMGVVYRAYDPDLDRALAIKIVGNDTDGSTRGERERARLLREAQAMARVNHPNVIQVFDVGELGTSVYVAMELVDGDTLKAWLVPKRTPAEILEVFVAAGRGLSAAHAQGLIHRDFKPDNVMVDRTGQPRVLDFGLARASHRPELDASDESLRTTENPIASLDASMTEAGTMLGTPAYMSPEQYRGDPADQRSDQFSFCVALFEALVGRRPFQGRTVTALSAAVTSGRIDMPARLPVSRGVMQAILRGLRVDPEERHPSMDALLAALRRQRTKSRNLGVLVGAAGVAVGAVALAKGSRPTEAVAPCRGADEAVAAVWTPQRRTTAADAFRTEAGDRGARIWAQVEGQLDGYLSAWAEARTDACEATRVRGEQSETLLDRRIACYDAKLRSVDATMQALETADATAVDHAHDAVGGLDPLKTCAQTERLLEAAPRPTEPAALAALEALEARHDALVADFRLGHYDTVLEPARALARDAEDLRFAPMRCDAWALVGDAESEAGSYGESVAAFEHALHAAIEADAPDDAALAAIEIGLTAGYFSADIDRGLRAIELGRAFARRAADPERLEIRATQHEASILVTKGDMSEALALHQKVRDYWQRHEGGRPRVATALLDMGSIYSATGRSEEAVTVLEEAVKIREDVYGKDHPLTANALRELGNGLSQLERFDEAEVQLLRALEIQEQARGRRTRTVAVLLDDIGRLLRARGDLEGAIERHREAYAILETVHGGENPALVVSSLNIGYTLNAAGKWEEALTEFVKALEMSERVSGPDHPHVVYAANAAASALVDQDRYDEAYVYAKQALDLEGKAEAPPTLFAESRFIATHALWKDGNVPAATKDRARALARRAREIYAEGPPHWAPYIEKIDAWLAEHG